MGQNKVLSMGIWVWAYANGNPLMTSWVSASAKTKPIFKMFGLSNDLQPFNLWSSKIPPHQFSWTINIMKSILWERRSWNFPAWSQQVAEAAKHLRRGLKPCFPQQSFFFPMEFFFFLGGGGGNNAKCIKSVASSYRRLLKIVQAWMYHSSEAGRHCLPWWGREGAAFIANTFWLKSSGISQVWCQQTDGPRPHPMHVFIWCSACRELAWSTWEVGWQLWWYSVTISCAGLS